MTAAQDSRALKPCPFCGSTAHFDIDDDNWEWVECSSCGMQGNRSASLMEDCKPKLAEAWNRRAALSAEPVAVPQGWQLVPTNPTEQMKRAAQAADMDHSPHSEWLKDEWGGKQRVWSAMLAAAPQPAAQGEAPENVRTGAPYDNPAFEHLARELGVWGTAQAAACAQFWVAAQSQSAFQTADGAALKRKPAPASRDCTRPECMSHGCFGHCMRKAPST